MNRMSMNIARTLTAIPVACVVALSALAHEGHDHNSFAANVEQAHGGEAYNAHRAVAADFHVDFAPMFELKGTMMFDTAVGKTRLELEDGTTVVFDGKAAWVSPEGAMPPGMARFHALTWPYFTAAAFKLDDPGVNLAQPEDLPWVDGKQPARKMTFAKGTGDAPDDWYYLFTTDGHRLEGMSYIVTYLYPKEKAEAEPHVVLYDDYTDVDGAKFPTKMTFKLWDKQQGVHGDDSHTATLSNIRFIEPDADMFTKPEGATEDKMPGS